MEIVSKSTCLACSADLTDEIRIKCAEKSCDNAYFCLTCFGQGVEPTVYHKKSHRYQVVEVLDFPLYSPHWAADEEALLIEGLNKFGMGNWEAVAHHLGTKTRQECLDHYTQIYLNSTKYPLPQDKLGKVKFEQAREALREWASQRANQPYQRPIVTSNRPLSSQPINHEIKGFMPGRGEFDQEPEGQADELVGDMEFQDFDLHEDLKMTICDIYNDKLTIRQEKKNFLFERGLIDVKRCLQTDKKRAKDEHRELIRLRVFSRFMPKCDLDLIQDNVHKEWNIRRRIAQLQEWRKMGITELRDGEDYEQEKRLHQSEPSSATSTPRRLAPTVIYPKNRPQPKALDIQDMAGVHLLQPQEQELCSRLRVSPTSYLKIKSFMIEECKRRGGLRKRVARELVQMDVNKTSRLWDFFHSAGWVWNPIGEEEDMPLSFRKKKIK